MPRKIAPRRALTVRSGAKSSPRRSGAEHAAPDPLEELYARGLTDGLPVVLPTRERVQAAVAASGRAADELIALVPPNFGRATV